MNVRKNSKQVVIVWIQKGRVEKEKGTSLIITIESKELTERKSEEGYQLKRFPW